MTDFFKKFLHKKITCLYLHYLYDRQKNILVFILIFFICYVFLIINILILLIKNIFMFLIK